MIDHMEETQKFMRRIKRIKIQDPKPGQFVDRCHFSKTGWGIWEGNGCTCVPAKAPKSFALTQAQSNAGDK